MTSRTTWALGIWTVRNLVRHTSRSIVRVEEYAAQQAGRADIAERGRVASGELGDDPVGVIQNATDRVIPLVDQVPGSTVIAYPYGGIRLDHYLETPVLALTVHTLDLAATWRGLLPDRFSVLG